MVPAALAGASRLQTLCHRIRIRAVYKKAIVIDTLMPKRSRRRCPGVLRPVTAAVLTSRVTHVKLASANSSEGTVEKKSLRMTPSADVRTGADIRKPKTESVRNYPHITRRVDIRCAAYSVLQKQNIKALENCMDKGLNLADHASDRNVSAIIQEPTNAGLSCGQGDRR